MFISEMVHIEPALYPDADRYDANPASDIFNAGLYDAIAFLLSEGVGGTGTATLTVEACTDNAGAGAETIPFRYRVYSSGAWGAWASAVAAGYLTIAGASKQVVIEVLSAELPAGKPWVRLQVTETVNSPVDAGVTAILSSGRYQSVSPVSPL
jgi:hypothetical protein